MLHLQRVEPERQETEVESSCLKLRLQRVCGSGLRGFCLCVSLLDTNLCPGLQLSSDTNHPEGGSASQVLSQFHKTVLTSDASLGPQLTHTSAQLGYKLRNSQYLPLKVVPFARLTHRTPENARGRARPRSPPQAPLI